MPDRRKILEGKLTDLVREWEYSRLPGRDTLIKTGQALQHWKRESGMEGIFERHPRFLTATLDDAWGMGLDLIELYADIADVADVHFVANSLLFFLKYLLSLARAVSR